MATLEEEEVDVFEVGAGAGEVGFDEVVATSPWVHFNGLYEMNTCSYGSFIKVVTFMRAFCNLIVKSREK